MVKGGRRKGAGRKPKKDAKVKATVNVSPDVLAFLNSTGNRSQAVEAMVRKTKAFKDWAKRWTQEKHS